MKTEQFWVTVEQMGNMTRNTCRVAKAQGQNVDTFEKEQIEFLKLKCEHYLASLENEEMALDCANSLKPLTTHNTHC